MLALIISCLLSSGWPMRKLENCNPRCRLLLHICLLMLRSTEIWSPFRQEMKKTFMEECRKVKRWLVHRKADLFLSASVTTFVTFVFTCWESLVMSTGLILLKAESLSSLSLACCSTAITKASWTWLFSANSLAKIQNIHEKIGTIGGLEFFRQSCRLDFKFTISQWSMFTNTIFRSDEY